VPAKPPVEESAHVDFRNSIEAQTSQASWTLANTSGGEPTEVDKTSFVLASKLL